jgi:ABC-type Mn2+/Zn2+ transport system permease subunit
MNTNLKLVAHLVGFISSFFIGYYFLNLNDKTGLAIIIGMCIGYVFCFFANRRN